MLKWTEPFVVWLLLASPSELAAEGLATDANETARLLSELIGVAGKASRSLSR